VTNSLKNYKKITKFQGFPDLGLNSRVFQGPGRILSNSRVN
jgi:hypothetical protein